MKRIIGSSHQEQPQAPPIQPAAQQGATEQATKIIERVIDLNLINDKLNYIISRIDSEE